MNKPSKPNPTVITVSSLGAALVLVLLVLSLSGVDDAMRGVIRAGALLAYLCVFLASLSSLFMKGIVKRVGQPFMKVHHTWVIAGLVGMIVHTVLIAWQAGSATVFVPRFDSLEVFLIYGGRPALLLFAVTALTAVFRAAIGKHWKILHWLNYLAFLLATVHAWLIGSSFVNWPMKLLAAAMALTLAAAFILKRARKPRPRRK